MHNIYIYMYMYFLLHIMPTGSWEAPMSGQRMTRPPPCGGLIMTKFDPSRAVYFGGRRETGYTNEAYILDLDKKVHLLNYIGVPP